MSARDELFRMGMIDPYDDDFIAAVNAYRAEVLREVYAAIEDPAQRDAVGGGLGWETGRDVVHNLLRKTPGGAP